MKIGNGSDRIDLTPNPATKPAAGKIEQKPAAAGESSVISLSELSSTMQSLETKVAKDPGFDQARVEQIKEAIRSGEFKINPDAIADKLIANVREMVGQTRH